MLKIPEELNCPTKLRIIENEPLSAYTTMGVGGTVSQLIDIPWISDCFPKVLDLCREQGIKPIILGNGSNIIAPDGELDLVVIKTPVGIVIPKTEGVDWLEIQAGMSLFTVCNNSVIQALTGLEFAYGIPGSVGGAIYMNAGAYDGEMSQVVQSVTVWQDGEILEIPAEQCGFSYRHSVFQDTGAVILSAKLKLRPGNSVFIRAKMDDLLRRRFEKQPLEYPSFGSAFKRPQNGYASELIERAGLKGFSVGGAQVSEKHAGFIINTGGATFEDVTQLIEHVRSVVKEKTGIELETEVRILG
ncbi:MAG: UDP-N-acetylmuramate dehydrogenase [Oscillospiraceae bacterium]|jgi:UDP-N-acetylmuramate dehydrogenase|nr:UDP-N-acetylmuramate dehydrogenase [Oscillospiraceae bacterium]